MTVVTTIALVVLFAAGLLCLSRLVRGRSIADRIVALDSLLLVVVSSVAVATVRDGTGAFVNVLLVGSLIAFVGSVTVARFIERRGT